MCLNIGIRFSNKINNAQDGLVGGDKRDAWVFPV